MVPSNHVSLLETINHLLYSTSFFAIVRIDVAVLILFTLAFFSSFHFSFPHIHSFPGISCYMATLETTVS